MKCFEVSNFGRKGNSMFLLKEETILLTCLWGVNVLLEDICNNGIPSEEFLWEIMWLVKRHEETIEAKRKRSKDKCKKDKIQLPATFLLLDSRERPPTKETQWVQMRGDRTRRYTAGWLLVVTVSDCRHCVQIYIHPTGWVEHCYINFFFTSQNSDNSFSW